MTDLQPVRLPPAYANVWHFLSSCKIVDTFLKWCDPRTLVFLAKTDTRYRREVYRFVQDEWDLDRFLSRWFHDSLGFRYLMARTGLLIAGSQALQFLLRICYEGSDLDLYVCVDNAPVAEVFITSQGYHLKEDPDPVIDQRHYTKGILSILNYSNGIEKIQLIVADWSPLECILLYHSTCVTNLIAWDRAISVYASATLIHNTSYVLHQETLADNARNHAAIAKYRERGWVIERSAREAGTVLPRTVRAFGDKHCWVIPFRRDGIRHPSTGSAFMKNRWMLVGSGHGNDHLYHRFTASPSGVSPLAKRRRVWN